MNSYDAQGPGPGLIECNLRSNQNQTSCGHKSPSVLPNVHFSEDAESLPHIEDGVAFLCVVLMQVICAFSFR